MSSGPAYRFTRRDDYEAVLRSLKLGRGSYLPPASAALLMLVSELVQPLRTPLHRVLWCVASLALLTFTALRFEHERRIRRRCAEAMKRASYW